MLPYQRKKIDISVSLVSPCIRDASHPAPRFLEIVSAGAAAVRQVWQASDP